MTQPSIGKLVHEKDEKVSPWSGHLANGKTGAVGQKIVSTRTRISNNFVRVRAWNKFYLAIKRKLFGTPNIYE